jgi:hypothetical protein
VASRSSVNLRQLARVLLRLNSVRPSSCTFLKTLAGSQGGCCSTHLQAQPENPQCGRQTAALQQQHTAYIMNTVSRSFNMKFHLWFSNRLRVSAT